MPAAIDTLGAMVPGGWDEVRQRNHQLALAATKIVAEAVGTEAVAPATMLGSMASIPLPAAAPPSDGVDDLQHRLFTRHGIEVPVVHWSGTPPRLLRISAQLYNDLDQFERLADALRAEGL